MIRIALAGPPRSGKSRYIAHMTNRFDTSHTYAPTTILTVTNIVAHISIETVKQQESETRDLLIQLVELSDTQEPNDTILASVDALLIFCSNASPFQEQEARLYASKYSTQKPTILVDSLQHRQTLALWPPAIRQIMREFSIKDIVPLPLYEKKPHPFPLERALEFIDPFKFKDPLKYYKILSTTSIISQKPRFAPTMLRVRLLSDNARCPVRSSPGAAGLDLFAAVANIVPAHRHILIPTDISIQLPPNTYGRVAPRSGLALKHGIDVMAGVIDQDYRGNVGVILFNHTDNDFVVNQHDRIAQLIIEKIEIPEVSIVTALDETARDAAGFGSTGK